MLLRRMACAGLFACGALGVLMLDPQYTSGQPGGGGGVGKGGGFGRGGGGFGQPPGGGGFGQPPGGGGFGQPPGGGGFGQPPGGGGGFGGGGDRAERTFGFLSQGKDTIDFSRMDPNMKAFARSAFERAGMPAPSDNTVVTKAQFIDGYNRAQAAKGISPGGSPQPGGPPSVTMSFGGGDRGRGFGGPPSGPGGPGFGNSNWQGGSGNWGGGNNNWQGGGTSMSYGGPGMSRDGGSSEREKMSAPTTFRMTDQDIERRFQESDVNKDGKLAFDEVSDRSPLKAAFQESDTNKDGSIDLNEYKAYIAARFGGDGSDPNAGSYGSYAGNGNYGRDSRDPRGKAEEQPVIAIRYGKLPAGLPSWWDSLDSDKDGQIGLYEWRQDGRDMKEFQKMDLDHDGVLAPQEWLRYNVLSAEQAKAIAAEEEIGGSGTGSKSGSSGRPSFGSGGAGGGWPSGGNSKSGGWPPSGGGKDKGSDKGSEKDRSDRDSKNPFRNGGGKK
ncbi:MAG: EF-hand domain-containing protein [Gemmataceae bacterium]